MNGLNQLLDEQLSSLGSHIRVVVLHPNFSQQHLILRSLPEDAVYLRLTGSSLNLQALSNQYTEAVNGTKKLKSTDTIILDETDRARPDALTNFMVETLLPQVKKGRIFLLGRQAPSGLMEHPVLRDSVAFLPHDQERMLSDYTTLDRDDEHLLEVWALGVGRVMIDGRLVENWDGVLPRSLFFYIVDRGMTTRAEIFEAFWPNLSVREATNVFHVTKRKVSEVLGTDLTVFQSGFYHLAPNIRLHYDVSLFNQYAQDSAVEQGDDALMLLRRAVSLYRGPFVSSLQTPWADRRRAEINVAYTDALIQLARVYESRNDAREALSWYLRAFHQMPTREDVVESALRLSKSLNIGPEGALIFNQYENALRETEGIKPAASLRKMAEGLKRG